MAHSETGSPNSFDLGRSPTLENLRNIFLFNLNALDRTLAPLAKIKTLQSIKTYYWWPKSEFQLLRDSLPELKYGSSFETELIDQFGM